MNAKSSGLFLSSAIQLGSHTAGHIHFGRKFNSQFISISGLLIVVVGSLYANMKQGPILMDPFSRPHFIYE